MGGIGWGQAATGRARIGKAVRERLLRSWALWDPRARVRYAKALAQGLGDKMRSVYRAELARQRREGSCDDAFDI